MVRPSLRPLFTLLAVVTGCVGGSSENEGSLDPRAMDAALNAIGDSITDGGFEAVRTDDCPVLAGRDILDALTEADILGSTSIVADGADAVATVRGPWGRYSVQCQHPSFDFNIRNGGPNDRDELVAYGQASTDDAAREIEPIEIDGLDAANTYEVRADGATQRVGWIRDELNVEVALRRGDEPADVENMATALTTVLEMLDEAYGGTATVDGPAEPPVDLGTIRSGLRSLASDVDDLRQGEQFETCPLASSGDVMEIAAQIGVTADDFDERAGYVTGSNSITDVTVQCNYVVGDASLSIGSALVEFDDLAEYKRVMESVETGAPPLIVDVGARADGLPDEAVYSVRQGEDIVAVGVLSGEVLVQLTVGRSTVDERDLLPGLSGLVDAMSAALG